MEVSGKRRNSVEKKRGENGKGWGWSGKRGGGGGGGSPRRFLRARCIARKEENPSASAVSSNWRALSHVRGLFRDDAIPTNLPIVRAIGLFRREIGPGEEEEEEEDATRLPITATGKIGRGHGRGERERRAGEDVWEA